MCALSLGSVPGCRVNNVQKYRCSDKNGYLLCDKKYFLFIYSIRNQKTKQSHDQLSVYAEEVERRALAWRCIPETYKLYYHIKKI